MLTGFFLLTSIAFTDLPPAVQHLMERMGIGMAAFPAYVRQIETSTAEREAQGEADHLIFFVLQSRQFTGAPAIEPALSAKEFVTSGAIPAAVMRRFRDFREAPTRGERMTYLKRMVPSSGTIPYLSAEYERVMRSLYEKEFQGRPDFYRTRGHSTDTEISANYAVWTALSVLRETQPGLRFARVLIIGPGLDFAPRTGFDDRYPPQSYQPYAVADALLSLGLSNRASIHCFDINQRVVAFFRDFPKRTPPVLRVSFPNGDAGTKGEAGDYLRYLQNLGKAIGTVRAEGQGGKTIQIRKDVAGKITAEKLNILTARRQERYDLAIATNVLVYFSDTELLLALANIQSALAAGGYLIHNELRPRIDEYAEAAGLTPLQARVIQVGFGAKAPLYDAFAIYRKGRK